MDAEQVLAAFREAAPDVQIDGPAQGVLERATRQARSVHPDLRIQPSTWGAALARAFEGIEPGQWNPHLESIRLGDLWLASALAEGNEAALAKFERDLVPQIDAGLRRFGPSDDLRAELCQRTRVRLLVAEPDRPPRIGSYRGRPSLTGWVRMVAGRLALNALRDARPFRPIEELPENIVVSYPHAAHLRSEHRPIFVRVLRGAFFELERNERNLLRLRYLERMTSVSLARAYRVHESTMSRRLASAREKLLDAFTRAATSELGETAGVRDLVDVMNSGFDASLHTLFASEVEETH
jgi:RNA polymerase sigma-70 factor, ECF subfamily